MHRVHGGRGLGLGPVDDRRGGDDEQGHHRHQRPGLLARQDHDAEGEHAGVADRVHLDLFDEIGDRVGVFVRVCGVGVVDAAAIGAELLDRLLAGGRIERDRLLGAFHGHRLGGAAGKTSTLVGECLGHAQRHEGQRHHDRDRQQEVEADPGQIDPEVAEAFAAVGDERPGDRGGQRDTRGGRKEVVRRQAGHLREGRHGRLRHIGLPVGISDEADRRVERQVRGRALKTLRIERQQVLEPEDQIEHDEAGHAEHQHGDAVAEPVLALGRIDPESAVEDTLHRSQHRIEPGLSALPDPRQIGAEGNPQGDRDGDGDENLAPASRVHVS